ncbi:MAG: diaminopropionate ammonia-lyase [Fusobacteriaceae bacterium]|nr:diaminopropionate ammonia-lyase [Fusobacteriaceae bacterium]
MELLKWIKNGKSRSLTAQKEEPRGFGRAEMEEVLSFHKSLPGYEPTPLADLRNLAAHCGVAAVRLKDESKRFGLNAFKVLGGSYAIGKYLGKMLGLPMKDLPFPVLISEEIRKKLGNLTFVTATDGNHGRGVAWMARQLGQKAVVYMPKGSAPMRYDNIAAEGAEVTITDLNYDDAVRLAGQKAAQEGWIMVQDTAWEGYEEIPLWIMQGYATIAQEIEAQLREEGADTPTHVFLQAGVGSFAGAIQGYLAERYRAERAITVICEPHGANCIYKSMEAGDGNPHAVTGDLKTIMAGLACGEPNTISWKILRDYADFAVSCDDSVAAHGMRALSSPLCGDKRIISGESGAVGLGLFTLLTEKTGAFQELRKALGIDEHSRILCVSTEGDTDAEGFRNIVWNGAYGNTK